MIQIKIVKNKYLLYDYVMGRLPIYNSKKKNPYFNNLQNCAIFPHDTNHGGRGLDDFSISPRSRRRDTGDLN